MALGYTFSRSDTHQPERPASCVRSLKVKRWCSQRSEMAMGVLLKVVVAIHAVFVAFVAFHVWQNPDYIFLFLPGSLLMQLVWSPPIVSLYVLTMCSALAINWLLGLASGTAPENGRERQLQREREVREERDERKEHPSPHHQPEALAAPKQRCAGVCRVFFLAASVYLVVSVCILGHNFLLLLHPSNSRVGYPNWDELGVAQQAIRDAYCQPVPDPLYATSQPYYVMDSHYTHHLSRLACQMAPLVVVRRPRESGTEYGLRGMHDRWIEQGRVVVWLDLQREKKEDQEQVNASAESVSDIMIVHSACYWVL